MSKPLVGRIRHLRHPPTQRAAAVFAKPAEEREPAVPMPSLRWRMPQAPYDGLSLRKIEQAPGN